MLAQDRTPEPAVAFVPTASGDADSYIVRFYTAFAGLPCRPSHLPLFRRTAALRAYVLAQDVIYVGGRTYSHSRMHSRPTSNMFSDTIVSPSTLE